MIDAIVLGAGVAGLGAAIPLQRAGKKVLVVSKTMKGESSPAAAGILDPFLEMKPGSPLFKLSREAYQNYPRFIQRLKKKTKKDVGFAKTGMLYVAMTAEEERELRKRYFWQRKSGIPVFWRARELLLKQEPEVSRRVRAGLFYPTIARVHPKKLVEALKQEAKNLGVQFANVSRNASLLFENKKAAGIRLGKKKIKARCVINATGSWAGKEIQPARGQILIVQGKLKTKTILHSLNGAYIVPWEKNRYLIGSTVEFAGFKPEVTSEGKQGIRKRNEALAPNLKFLKEVDSWAGLRPFPKDRLPLIGPTSIQGLYLAGGYYRSGILIGWLAGELLSKAILTGKMLKILKPFSPMRFR